MIDNVRINQAGPSDVPLDWAQIDAALTILGAASIVLARRKRPFRVR